MTAPNGPILFNSSTGSDTQASGLGPATALFGSTGTCTNASAIVTGIDTTGVTAGDLFWGDTSSGRQFSIIASVDSGTQVTLDDTLSATHSGNLTWAIGGKRASLFSDTNSQLLLTSDMKAGWTCELGDGHTESFSSAIDFTSSGPIGDTSDGLITIRGESNAATMPVVTSTVTATQSLVLRRAFWYFENFELTSSGTGRCVTEVGSGINTVYRGMIFRNWAAAAIYLGGTTRVFNCEFDSCETALENTAQNGIIEFNYIHDCTSHGIDLSGTMSGLKISNNLIVSCGGCGIRVSNSRNDNFGSVHIDGNIIYDSGSHGIEYYSVPNTAMSGSTITKNIITESLGFGLNFSHASSTATLIDIHSVSVDMNAFYASTSGHRNNVNAGDNDVELTADPFVDAASGNFNINNDAGGGALLREATVTL